MWARFVKFILRCAWVRHFVSYWKRADSTRTAYLLNRYYAIQHEQLPWCIWRRFYCNRQEEAIVSTSSYRMHNQFPIKTWNYQCSERKDLPKTEVLSPYLSRFFFFFVNFTTYAYFCIHWTKNQKQRRRIRKTSEVVAWAFNFFSPT